LSQIQVTPANLYTTLPTNYSEAYTATGVCSDNSTQDLTKSATWTVSPASIGSISTSGVLATGPSAVTGGTITATLSNAAGSVSGTSPVNVIAVTLQSVQVSPSSVSPLPANASQQFSATGTYVDANGVPYTFDVTTQPGSVWGSSDTTVVQINGQGLATAQGPLAPTPSDRSASITFQLTPPNSTPVNAPSVTVTVPSTLVISYIDIDQNDFIEYTSGVNSPQQLTATAYYCDTTDSSCNSTSPNVVPNIVATFPIAQNDLTWSFDAASPNNNVVALDTSLGVVKVNSSNLIGTAYIDASYTDPLQSKTFQSQYVTVTVSAASLTSIAVMPTSASIANGTTIQYSATGTYSDGTTGDLTTKVYWTATPGASSPGSAIISNDPGTVASGGTQGQLAARAAGNVTVTAKAFDGTLGSTSLTITPATLSSIVLTTTAPASSAAQSVAAPTQTSALTMALGFGQQLYAVGVYSDSTTQDITNTAVWNSADSTTVTVTNFDAAGNQIGGTLSGLAVTATPVNVIAQIGTKQSLPTAVTVVKTSLSGITISPRTNPDGSTLTIASGGKLQFKATGIFTDPSISGPDLTKQVSWSIPKSKHAVTISNKTATKGLVTAPLKPSKSGTVQIYASMYVINGGVATTYRDNVTLTRTK